MLLSIRSQRMIPNELGITIEKALENESRNCGNCMKQMSSVKRLIDMSKALGRTAETYIDARGRSRDLAEADGRVCTAYRAVLTE